MNNDDLFYRGLMGGLTFGIVLFIFYLILYLTFAPHVPNQDTLNEICFQLTNKTGVIGEVSHGGLLVCETPSFDSTDKIIIKTSGDRE